MNGFSSGGSDLSTASALSMVQQAVIVVSSAWSALYFAFRLRDHPSEVASVGHGSAGRRVAAGVLALLFTAIAVEALAGLPVAATSAEVARRTPLLLATVSVAIIVSYRPRGAR